MMYIAKIKYEIKIEYEIENSTDQSGMRTYFLACN